MPLYCSPPHAIFVFCFGAQNLALDVVNKLKTGARRGFAPGGDEAFFSTLLMETSFQTTLCGFENLSSLKEKGKAWQQPLPRKFCFEKWGGTGRLHPMELTKDNIEELRNSNAIFARKLKYTKAGTFLRRLVDSMFRNTPEKASGGL